MHTTSPMLKWPPIHPEATRYFWDMPLNDQPCPQGKNKKVYEYYMIMRKIFFMGLLLFAMYGCSQSGNGELIGVRSIPWSEPTPYGMVLVPQGSFEMGQAENDSIFGLNNPSKHVSVSSFWMDETEITNGQYKQFVQWVCDSIIREKMADPAFGGNSDYKITEDR